MTEGEAPPEGLTINALLAACGSDIVGLRGAALISLANDAGRRLSELVSSEVADLRQVGNGSGPLDIVHSKTNQLGERGGSASLHRAISGFSA